MLRRMVNSHALRLVPGWNFSELLQARRSASWTRSSASETEPDREIANARKFLISPSSPSLKLAVGIAAPLGLRSPVSSLEASQQFHELFRQRRLNQVGVVSLQRPSDRLQGLRVGRREVRHRVGVLASSVHDQHPRGGNAGEPIWFPAQEGLFIAAKFRRPGGAPLRQAAPGKPEDGRNEERDQGDDEYDLRGGESGSGDDAEAECAGDQGNDKKGDRPTKHDVLLTAPIAVRLNVGDLAMFQCSSIGASRPVRPVSPLRRVATAGQGRFLFGESKGY